MSDTKTDAPAQDTTKADATAKDAAPDTKAADTTKDTATDKKADAAAQPAKTDDKKDAAADKKVVPEKYDLKAPDGSLIDAAALERIASVAKERGLSNEEAQALVEQQDKTVKDFVDQRAKVWAEDAKNDKEIGGEALNRNVELAKRVIDRFGSDTLKGELNKTGYGNHPEMVRLLTRIGKTMSEDQLVLPKNEAGASGRSMEEVFYGKPKEK